MAIGTDYKEIFKLNSAGNKETVLKSDTDLIKAELELLLNFKKHSLFFGNDIGLDLEKYINLSNRVATFNLIKADIEKLIAKYKKVKLKSINIEFSDAESVLKVNVVVTTGNYESTIDLSMLIGG